jgi:hypothetical protein
MIEIRITIDTALSLLLERMKLELRIRQKEKRIMPGVKLEELPQKMLKDIVETAVFDTIFLLPIDLITTETNLVQIITSTIRALAKVLNREEFLLYSSKQSQRLINPINIYFQNYLKENNFSNN